jgi:glycosyltransferase involved in cell wall biosynthesis
MMPKICHLTSIHSPTDVRIFLKETASLAENGFEVHLVAPGTPANKDTHSRKGDGDVSVYHSQGNELPSESIFQEKGIIFHNVQQSSGGRLFRMTKTVWAVYRQALQIDADLYHFHDPELIPIGILLKLKRKRVILDVHEDLPKQILTKHWIPLWARRIIAESFRLIEVISTPFFDGVVVVTSAIAQGFPQHKTELVQNFPLITELVVVNPIPYRQRPPWATFVGGITEVRGITEMLKAMELLPEGLNIKLMLAGLFRSNQLQKEAEKLPGWGHVEFLGWQSRVEVANLLAKSRLGLVLYHPVPNHVKAQPNKLFEYMSAGLPVIASDFSLWREIISEENCGLLVDPLDPAAIAEAIQYLFENPEEAEAMGTRGQQAVVNKYNWDVEAKKLVSLYNRIL